MVATWWVFFLVGALAWDGLGATTTARGEPALPSRCRSMGVSSSRGFTTGREVSHLVECSSHYVGYTLIVPHSREASGWGYCSGGGTSERVLILQWSSWEFEPQLQYVSLLTCHHYHRGDGATTGETVSLVDGTLGVHLYGCAATAFK